MTSAYHRWKLPNEISVVDFIEFSPQNVGIAFDFVFLLYKTINHDRWDLERLFKLFPFSPTIMNTYTSRARISFAFQNRLSPIG